jgi:diaminopimelate epimerase
MRIKFTKMHGLGNDFVVLEAFSRPIALTPQQVTRIADRRFGVGCDQVLLIEPPRSPDTDFYYRIYNPDGGEVEQCGNGARCFLRYVRDHGMTSKSEIRVGTRAGVIAPRLEGDGRVTVDMGVPQFEPARIPFDAPARATTYDLSVDGRSVEVSVLALGNPHAVQVVADIERAPVATEGPLIERHPRFPQRVNAGYLEVVSRRRIRLRVYERGAGETLACGSGACAAVVVGITRSLLDRDVVVTTRGGDLGISWAGAAAPVMMTGPAETVFEGEMEI